MVFHERHQLRFRGQAAHRRQKVHRRWASGYKPVHGFSGRFGVVFVGGEFPLVLSMASPSFFAPLVNIQTLTMVWRRRGSSNSMVSAVVFCVFLFLKQVLIMLTDLKPSRSHSAISALVMEQCRERCSLLGADPRGWCPKHGLLSLRIGSSSMLVHSFVCRLFGGRILEDVKFTSGLFFL